MLNAEAIREIQNGAAPVVQSINGHQFAVSAREGAKFVVAPLPVGVTLFSLTQIVNYAKTLKPEDIMINIQSEQYVQILEAKRGAHLAHGCLADADFEDVITSFNSERKYSQEDFIVEVQTKFEDTTVRTELLTLASNIKAEKIATSTDDGYSQVATAKAGVSLSTEQKVKNRFALKAFKTFPEIEQPTIPYVLRLHQHASEMPQFGLYECDGEAWRVETTSRVRSYLTGALPNYLVL